MWLTGLVAPWHVGSSRTRARTRVPCIGRQILNRCATREAHNTFLTGISYSLSLFEYPSIKLPDQSCLNNDFIMILSSKYIHSDFLLPYKCENPLICKLSQNIIPSNISEPISLTPPYACLPNKSSLLVTTKR